MVGSLEDLFYIFPLFLVSGTCVLFVALRFLITNHSHELDILQSILNWRGSYSYWAMARTLLLDMLVTPVIIIRKIISVTNLFIFFYKFNRLIIKFVRFIIDLCEVHACEFTNLIVNL
jgi:hypothetical protein